MAIYPLSFPAQTPSSQRLTLNRRQSISESPYNLNFQAVNTASQWMLEWTWPRMPHLDAEIVHAWLNALQGQVGTFRYFPKRAFNSSITGKTLALPGYAYGSTVSIGGWTPNAQSGLRVGQYFQIGDQLLQIVSSAAVADGAGKVTVEFQPSLRSNFAQGAAVNLSNPSGLFRLMSSDGLGYTLDPDRAPEFGTIQAREVVQK